MFKRLMPACVPCVIAGAAAVAVLAMTSEDGTAKPDATTAKAPTAAGSAEGTGSPSAAGSEPPKAAVASTPPAANAPPPGIARPDPSQVREIKPARPTGAIPEPTVVLKPGQVPAIRFDATEHDFGRVPAGDQITHTFQFTNSGDGPLEILAVKPGCGCTTAGQYDRIVQPGHTGKIPLQVNTKNLAGRINKPVKIHTNAAGSSALVTLSFVGEVWKAVEVTPTIANFGRITLEQARASALTRSVSVVNNVGDTLNITHVRSSNPAFAVSLEVVEPGKSAALVVRLTDSIRPGPNSARIELSTGVVERPSLTFRTSAYVAQQVEVVPRSVWFTTPRPAAVSRFVTVRNNGARPIEVTGVATSNPCIQTTWTARIPGKEYRVMIQIPPSCDLASTGETVTISTSHPDYPTLIVPIRERPLSRGPVRTPLARPVPTKRPAGSPTARQK